jgi:hypothetical protein
MIVKVIAAQIGEGCRLERNTVKTVLIKAMRGRLECNVGHAIIRKLSQRFVKRNRVRRRQRAADAASRFY